MARERSEEPSLGWIEVRRFSSPDDALHTYEATRDLLVERDLDASVLRITLDGVSYVAMLGEEPLVAEERAAAEGLLDAGAQAELPQFAIEHLRTRRREFKTMDIKYLEGRWR